MGDAGTLAYFIKQYPNDLESGYLIITDYAVGPGINKSLPELRQAIADALTALQANGTHKALMEKNGVDAQLERPVTAHTE